MKWQHLVQDDIFWFCAIAGSGMFALQFLFSLFGIGDSEEPGESVSLEAAKIKWLSKQAVTGFLMMFGWTALACKQEFSLSLPLSVILALTAGFLTVIATAFLFKGAKSLHSSGTIFDLDQAVGKEAVVYHRIAKNGIGKISVSMDGHLHEVDAISLNGDEIDSFLPVIVAKKIDTKTVAVTVFSRVTVS